MYWLLSHTPWRCSCSQLLISKWMFKRWLMAVECLGVKLACTRANQGSFTGSSSHVSAVRQLPAAEHQPSAVLTLGQVHSLAGMQTAVCWCECMCVLRWCPAVTPDRHALVSGRPLPVQSSYRKSHSLTRFTASTNSCFVEELQHFEQEHSLLQPRNKILKCVPEINK